MEGSKARKKKDFESIWAERFAEAEAAPAAHVWKNISGELANRQVGSYKRRVFYYQWAAAASLFIALVLGALYFTTGPTGKNNDQIVEAPVVVEKNPSSTAMTQPTEEFNHTRNTNPIASIGPTNESLMSNEDQRGTTAASDKLLSDGSTERSVITELPIDNSILLTEIPQENEQSKDLAIEPSTIINSQDDLLFLSHQIAKSTGAQWLAEATAVPEIIYGVPIYGNAHQEKDEKNNQSLWAGLNLGSGNFDPNYGPPSGSLDESSLVAQDARGIDRITNTNAGLPLREESNSGPSIAVGIDVGKSVGKRWVLQSGLTYGRYRVNSNTNLVFSSANQKAVPLSFQNREALFSEEEVTVISESVEVDNNFQLLSIPVKAGFVLIDKKFNVLLNTGLAGDIYLGNNLNATGEEFASYSIDPGTDSPYRRLHLNGLTSVQLGYQIQDNYYLSIEPSFRKAISDFAKAGNNFSSRPSNLGLVVGFRYLFR